MMSGAASLAESWAPMGLVAVVVLAAAAGLVLHALVAWLIGKFSRRVGSPVGASLARHARAPARVVFALASVEIVLLGLNQPDRLLEPMRHVAALGLIAATAWLVVRLSCVVDWEVEAYYSEGTAGMRGRRVQTRVRVIRRVIAVAVWVVAAASMLMTFPRAWQMGASLLASAGIMGLVAGIAARPVLANLIAGVQIAMTQPIRLEDAVVVDGQFGWVEEITATYVVLRTREERRMVVPVTFFVEKSFENWTRSSLDVVVTSTVSVERETDVRELREGLRTAVERSGMWDGRVFAVEVTGVQRESLELRLIVSAADAARAWTLQAEVREAVAALARRAQKSPG